MTKIRLKNYQSKTLDVLRAYLEQARYSDAKTAYETILRDKLEIEHFKPYQTLPASNEESVPYVCLRLPTGGGKTLLSAYTIQLSAESYIEREYPVTLWFVPSDAIKVQTLETLKKETPLPHRFMQHCHLRPDLIGLELVPVDRRGAR